MRVYRVVLRMLATHSLSLSLAPPLLSISRSTTSTFFSYFFLSFFPSPYFLFLS